MQKRNLTMGVFVAYKDFKNPTLAKGKADDRRAFLEEIQASVSVAKRVNAKWMTVVPGTVDLKLVEDYQTANVIESLKQASAILEPHGIVMVLEPLNWYRNHAGLFLKESPQAFQICKAVNSPSCKILFDIYHQQIQEGNLIPNIEKCWGRNRLFPNWRQSRKKGAHYWRDQLQKYLSNTFIQEVLMGFWEWNTEIPDPIKPVKLL